MKKASLVAALVASLVVFTFTNAMAERVVKSFNINGTQTLLLQNLFANVTVKVGNGNSVIVVISGDKKSIKDISMRQNDSHLISVKGKGSNGGGNSISVSNSGGVTIITSGSGNVIVNGKRISSGEECKPASVEITVPRGTNVDASHVYNISAKGVNGKLNASIDGQGSLDVQEATGVKLKCSGQSKCKVSKASGEARAFASGQSDIFLAGNMRDVEADASGQSEIRLAGSCHNIDADASGQSDISGSIRITGRVNKNASDTSEISLR